MATIKVAPRRGAWIEMLKLIWLPILLLVAPRRGAWIEINVTAPTTLYPYGRTPQGCVDRNRRCRIPMLKASRRTPQGCVDRNLRLEDIAGTGDSRTPQGCVDRNMVTKPRENISSE